MGDADVRRGGCSGRRVAAVRQVTVGAHSPLAFQGILDDARNLLIAIAGTMVTVIALLLGLTVVALQLSSTQFSPRLLRNFLRDRPNQIVLSAFVAHLCLQRCRAVPRWVCPAGNRPPPASPASR